MTEDFGSAFAERPWARWAVWPAALLCFVFALAVFSRHHDFPYYYHPDEPTKARQILTGKWNFHHPMLLLSAAKAFTTWQKTPSEEQAIVEAGREVSAIFMACAVVGFSLLALAWRGPAAALLAALALVLHHQLFELAHYFKEDAALLFGVGATLLLTLAFSQKPTLRRSAALGAAVAIAISGKYLGAVLLAIALPLLWTADRNRRPHLLGMFALGLLLGLVLLNLPILLDLTSSRQSLGREMDLVVHGQGGTTRHVPHTQYWNIFRDNTTLVTSGFLLVFLYARWRERRRLRLAEWLIIGFPFAFALLLSFSPKSNDRYFLPATATLTVLAAIGVLDTARLLAPLLAQFPRSLRLFTAVCGVAFVGAQLPSWLEYDRAFRADDNADLIAWIKQSLPLTATLVKDSRIQLAIPAGRGERPPEIPQRVVENRFAADAGSLEELPKKGIEYAIVSQSDYGRFSLPGLKPKPDERATFERRKAFYENLFRDGKLLWSRDRGAVLYLHPGIRVYRLLATKESINP